MPLITVNDKKSIKAFYDVPFLVYDNDPNWIPPLYEDLSFIFNPEKNPAFQEGDLQRWVLQDHTGKNIGRIAAFTKSQRVMNEEYEVGGMGFFECIDDEEAAFSLFHQAQSWLESKGIKAMDGPINFGERDRFWGLLVEGFKQPSYQENYNPHYYQRFFENYGFQQYFRQETFEVKKGELAIDRLKAISDKKTRNSDLWVTSIDTAKIDQFAADFITVYNRAWEHFQNFKPLSKEEVKQLFKQVKPILEKDFLLFSYSGNEPAGILFMLPDVNQIFQYFKGRMGLLEKLQFLYHRKMGTMNKLKGIVMGVHPDFQKQGVDALMIYHLVSNVETNQQYNQAELSWIGDFNPKMKAIMSKLNAKVSKVHITYRKLFDPDLTFEPYRIND